MAGTLAGRRQELERLDAAEARGSRLFWVHGPAGEGKSALLRHWLTQRPHTVAAVGTRAADVDGILSLDGWDPARDAELIEALRANPTLRIVVSAREAPSLALRAATEAPFILALAGLDEDTVTMWLRDLPAEHAKTLQVFAHGHP